MPVSEVEPPKKRQRKPVVEVATETTPEAELTIEQRLDSLKDELGEVRASIEVLNEDMVGRMEDVAKVSALSVRDTSKDSASAFTKLNESILRLTERAELRDQRFDALLAVLAFCDRVPRRRFDTLLSELRTLAEKPDQAATAAGSKPLPAWQLVGLWLVGSVVFVLAFIGLLDVLR